MSAEWLYVIAGLIILIGLLGTVLPLLPGVPLVFAGMLLAAWAGDFQHIGFYTLLGLGLLTLIAILADFMSGALGAKSFGASSWAFYGAAIGAFIGIFFGLPGILMGPFLGALGGELLARKKIQQAAKAGFGAVVGLLLGAVAKIGLAFTMLGIFLLALWWE